MVKPLDDNSTISLGAGEEGNRNLRETERAASDTLKAADSTCRAHDARYKSGKTGVGLLVDFSPSCHQLPSEDLVKSSGSSVSGISPTYSWLTGSRFKGAGTFVDSREGGSSDCTSKKETNKESGRGDQGTDDGFGGITTRPRLTAAEGSGGGGGGDAEGGDEKRQGGQCVNSWEDNAAADLFVDEEELVGKAIKALRTAPKSTSLRWPPDDGRLSLEADTDGNCCIERASIENRHQVTEAISGEIATTAGRFSSTHGTGEGSSVGRGEEPEDDCVQIGNDWLMKVSDNETPALRQGFQL